MFILVTDALSRILNKAQATGFIKGLGHFNNNKIVINLNFADDTLIFLTAHVKQIEGLKLLLIGFENLSGLKINYSKSEVIPLNLQEEESTVIANILNL